MDVVCTQGIMDVVCTQHFQKINIFYSLILIRMYAYQEVRNVSFLGKSYVRAKWIKNNSRNF